MTMLTRIGNLQGIRIPKPLIIQAHLENVQINLEVVKNLKNNM
jgi:antitoxin MazE